MAAETTQQQLGEWQLPIVDAWFALRTKGELDTALWGEIMELMAIYIRPRLVGESGRNMM